jgi:hypothetical protein
VRFFELSVEIVIRTIIFVVPISFVAQWCDLPPTWKSAAFLAFYLFWYDFACGTKAYPASRDDPSAQNNRKAAANAMTPAEVAAEARKLGRQQRPAR